MRFFLLASLLFLPFLYLSAQTPAPSAVLERRAQLEADLAALEKEIEDYRGLIQSKQNEAQSLERDIAILDAQINKAKLEIKARTLAISRLAGQISEKTETISALEEKIRREKASLAELLRKLHEFDQSSLVEILLGYNNLSEFFVQADSFNIIQEALQLSFGEIRSDRDLAGKERDDLEDRKAEEVQLKGLQELEKKRIEEREAEKKKILQATRGQEKAYQKILGERAK
ncbi:MAG TPA: hypothetical protein VJL09_02250, partial [Candidatus Paceibacterota bacterium]